jgi:hypothetical protein
MDDTPEFDDEMSYADAVASLEALDALHMMMAGITVSPAAMAKTLLEEAMTHAGEDPMLFAMALMSAVVTAVEGGMTRIQVGMIASFIGLQADAEWRARREGQHHLFQMAPSE